MMRRNPAIRCTSATVRPGVALPWSLLVMVVAALASCDGSDIKLGKRSAQGADIAQDQGSLTPPPATEPVCLADSDCAPLATAACAQAVCEPIGHRCLVIPRADFSTCSTGKACDVGACLAGTCIAVERKDAADCDDANPCTQDQCEDGKGGCTHTSAPYAACSDGNPCTIDDHCSFGACVTGKNACACTSDNDCAGFASEDKCAGQLLCSEGACVPDPASQPACDDQNPCTKDGCEPSSGACTHTALTEGTVCDDGDACTLQDRCATGKCTGSGPLPCTLNGSGCAMVCDSKLGCVADPAGGACDDGNPCTQKDFCHAGACVGQLACECQVDSDCVGKITAPACLGKPVCSAGKCSLDADLAEPCTQTGSPGKEFSTCEINLCTIAGCAAVAKPVNSPCDANGFCTFGDKCGSDGQCSPGVALDCDDGNGCTVDTCNLVKVTCDHAPNQAADGKLCDDGNPCTIGESCLKTACQGGKTACDDGDPCTADLCDPAAPQGGGKNACLHKKLPEGAECDDGDACTTGGVCSSGTCVFATVQACDDGNPCTEDACNGTGGCVHNAVKTSEPLPCDDGDSCTSEDTCLGGACKGLPGKCQCQSTKDCLGFEDGNLCNGTLVCQDHACVVDPASTVNCPGSLNPCVGVQCQASTGTCVEVALTLPGGGVPVACSDGDACTIGDACLPGGICGPGKPVACDDGNACTSDACDPVSGCVAVPWPASASVPCDDGNACTFGDFCSLGACSSGANACQCQADADCLVYDDGDACNGGLVCKQGTCVSDGKGVTCPAGSSGPCVTTQCDPGSGKCLTLAIPDGTSCDAPASCASGGQCQGGTCVGATVQGCDDFNPCTADVCLPAGCTHTVSTGLTCDDGNPCSTAEKCNAQGQCGGGSNSCACKVDSDCPDDGDACNGTLQCAGNTCQPKPGSVVICTTSGDTACQKTACDKGTGQCLLAIAATGSACDDGDACSLGEACSGGKCTATKVLSCDDGNPCSSDGCNPASGCYHLENDFACDDGNPCTLGDTCSQGKCVGQGGCDCATDGDCAAKDDGNLCNGILKCKTGKCSLDATTIVTCDPSQQTACTVPTCDPKTGVCAPTNVPDGSGCSDGDGCTTPDQCVQGKCLGTALNCDDKNPCTTDACDQKVGCVLIANSAPCEDGNACTAGDKCSGGSCVSGKNTCGSCQIDADCKDDGDLCNGVPSCQAGVCATKPGSVVTCPTSGICSSSQCIASSGQCVTVNKGDGSACDDGDVCTGSSACFGGSCVGAAILACDDNNPCTTDTCDAKGGCLHGPTFGTCDDGNPCTQGDVCSAQGVCVGGANQCKCLQDSDCKDDGDVCNGVLICQGNQCVVKAGSVVTCDASQDTACSKATCDKASGKCSALASADGTVCDDGSLCTTGEKCAGGACQGQALGCDDGSPCTDDSCDAKQGCVHKPNAAPCSDGSDCTQGDTCSGGACVAGPSTCNCVVTSDCGKFEDGNLCNGTLSCLAGTCTVDVKTVVTCGASGSSCSMLACDPKSGQCLASPVQDGQPCGGADLCGGSGACKAGQCLGASGCADDSNPCTTASCDGKGTCSQVPNSGPCSDGNNCTLGDQCAGGKCLAGANQCNCKADGDCVKFDDGNLCNGTYACKSGQCQPDPSTAITCPPAPDGCTISACDPSQGKCITQAAANGTACDDGDACTSAGQCFAGTCLVKPVVCDDANPCTADSCDKTGGCVNKAVPNFPPTTCNDGSTCTPIDICQGGKCQGVFNTCFCQKDSDCKDDGNLCNGTPSCQGGTCKTKPGTVVTCDTTGDSACAKTTCLSATGLCAKVPAPAGTSCDDGSACTGGDVCSGGVCFGVPLDCLDKVACTLDSCDPKGGCVHVANDASCGDNDACTKDVCDAIGGCLHQATTGGPCDDANPCTTGETCGLGPSGTKCFGGVAVSCDDKNPCTADACDVSQGCVHKASGGVCDDGDACTTGDGCIGTTCTGKPVNCDDGNPCTADACGKAGCGHVAQPGSCDDGNACTSGDGCSGGVCQGTIKVVCDDKNVCTADSCDPGKGCVTAAIAGCCTANSQCVDGNACTVDACDLGKNTCSFVNNGDPTCCNLASDCNDGDGCTSDACTGNKCTHAIATGSPCNDNSLCTGADTCQASGACVGTASVVCNDANTCTTDSCNPTTGGCNFTPNSAACSDGNACTVDACSGGSCVSKPSGAGTPCDDGQVCTVGDGCSGGGTCVGSPNACDDGLACTADSCDSIKGCVHTPLPGFSATFDDGTLGGIATQSLNNQVSWSVDSLQASTKPNALYVGRILPNGTHTYNVGPTVATATLPSISIPAGVSGATLTFDLYYDRDKNEAATCNGFVDSFSVLIANQIVNQTCKNTGGFVPIKVDLSSQVGKTVAIAFSFVSNLNQNNGQGAWIDNVKVSWSCP
jgi:hypothetical protein